MACLRTHNHMFLWVIGGQLLIQIMTRCTMKRYKITFFPALDRFHERFSRFSFHIR